MEYDGTITLASSVKDIGASLKWFKEALGFDEIFHAPAAGWAEITTPAEGISIGLGQNEEVDGKGGSTPVFGVKDIAAARAELESKKVKFDGDTVEIPGMVKLATFYDLDGNTYMLAETTMQSG